MDRECDPSPPRGRLQQAGQPDLRLIPEFVAYGLRGVAPRDDGEYAEPDLSITRPRDRYDPPAFAPLLALQAGTTRSGLDPSYDGVGSVWNRGHLTMSDHAQRISGEAACNTHNFWNASPQAADLNQGPWRHLENYSAAAANKFRSLWIITGPIFDPATPKLTVGDGGEARVEVPDGSFKVLVHEGPNGVETLAFIYDQPHAPGAPGRPAPTAAWVNCNRNQPAYDHAPQLVWIAQIELRTGLVFFEGHPDREALTSTRAPSLWPVERRFWAPGSTCANQRGHP